MSRQAQQKDNIEGVEVTEPLQNIQKSISDIAIDSEISSCPSVPAPPNTPGELQLVRSLVEETWLYSKNLKHLY